MDGVLILIIEVASTLFTHGPLGGFSSPTVLASSNSNYLLEENMAYWKNARLWAVISWSDNTSRDLQFARVPFTALLYANFFQQILALHHDLFKTLLYWLTSGHRSPDFADISILNKPNWRYTFALTITLCDWLQLNVGWVAILKLSAILQLLKDCNSTVHTFPAPPTLTCEPFFVKFPSSACGKMVFILLFNRSLICRWTGNQMSVVKQSNV